MDLRTTSLSVHHARLITGHIQNTLTEAEADELDEWICASDENMQIFEVLTEQMAAYAGEFHQFIGDADASIELWVIAGLMAKEYQGCIEPEEKQRLDEWINTSPKHKALYLWLRNPVHLSEAIRAIVIAKTSFHSN